MSDDTEEIEHETGPFCRHYADPADCEESCARCGHHCCRHYFDAGECFEDGCDCPQWMDSEEVEPAA